MPRSRPPRPAWKSTSSISSFTKVTSPIDGQVSRYYLTLGNLVIQDQTLLTTVVSLDPMYAYFDVDERHACCGSAGRSTRGRSSAIRQGRFPCSWACKGEDGFPHQGPSIRQQPGEPDHGQHLGARQCSTIPSRPTASACCRRGCSCGSACRSANRIRRCLVIDRAIGSDQGLKYVYVVDAKNMVQYRRVTTGALQDGRTAGDHRGIEAGRVGGRRRLQQSSRFARTWRSKTEPMPMPTIGKPRSGQRRRPQAGRPAAPDVHAATAERDKPSRTRSSGGR